MTAELNEIAAALAIAQGQFPAIAKAKTANVEKDGKKLYSYKYADLADVLAGITPVLSANGIAVTSLTLLGEKGLILESRLVHKSGQYLAAQWPLPTSARPQDMGSAITYAKRYTICALAGVTADDDDDGAAAQKAPPARPRSTPSPAPAKAAPANGNGTPHHPETGEVDEGPRALAVSGDSLTAWQLFGSTLVEQFKVAPTRAELSAWRNLNSASLRRCGELHPKIRERIDLRYEEAKALMEPEAGEFAGPRDLQAQTILGGG